MSPTAERILNDFKALSADEQVALSERIGRIIHDTLVPERVRVRSNVELVKKIREGRRGARIPVTPEFWRKLHAGIGKRRSHSA